MRLKSLICIILLVSSATAAKPKRQAPPNLPDPSPEEQLESQLHYQQGTVTLKDGLATLNVPKTYRYLDPQQTEKLLVEGWGNPEGSKTLGMLLPAGISPFDIEKAWGVVITYREDGYVKDNEAASIDYNDLLKQIKEATEEENKDRRQKGFDPIEVVGWAEPPHYDGAAHKLYWAKELRFGDSPENTLNYDIRVLGRRGVLSLNAVASMSQISDVRESMKDVLGLVEFTPGNRYTDFHSGMDKVAEYGVGALILGGIAVKTGLLKGLLVMLLAAKKFIIIGLVAAAGFVRKLFWRRS